MRSLRSGLSLAVLIGLLVVAPRARAQSSELERHVGVADGLRADDVSRAAVATSPDLHVRVHELDAAARGVDQALVAFFPRLTVGASYTRLSDLTMPSLGTLVAAPGASPGQPLASDQTLVAFGFQFPVLLNQTYLRAQLQVPISDYFLRITPALEAAESSRDAAQHTREATERRVDVEARALYFAWARAHLQAIVADESLAIVRDHEVQARARVEAGLIPEADATRVAAQVASAELLASRAHTLETVLADRVRTVMHAPDARVLEIGDALASSVPDIADAPEVLVEEALGARPELAALRAQVRAIDRQAAVVSAGAWPQLVGVGEVLTANPNPRIVPSQDRFDATWSVGVALAWSPNDLGAAIPATSAVEARREAAGAQLASMSDAIRGEVLGAWQQLRDARAALTTTERGLTAAEATYASRRASFGVGHATTLELLDAEIDLTRARLEALGARVDAATARARMSYALGR